MYGVRRGTARNLAGRHSPVEAAHRLGFSILITFHTHSIVSLPELHLLRRRGRGERGCFKAAVSLVILRSPTPFQRFAEGALPETEHGFSPILTTVNATTADFHLPLHSTVYTSAPFAIKYIYPRPSRPSAPHLIRARSADPAGGQVVGSSGQQRRVGNEKSCSGRVDAAVACIIQ